MVKDYVVRHNDAGQRLDKFVLKLAPNLHKTVLYRSFRKKDIRLNGATAQGKELLKEGDIVSAYLHSKFFEEDADHFLTPLPPLDILYEDNHLLIAHKPAGLLMHPNKKDTRDSMSQRLLYHLICSNSYDPKKELTFRPAFVNRLDRNTQGLVLGAKDFNTLQLLNEKMKQREIIRKYLAVIEGCPAPLERTVTGYWSKDGRNNKVTVSPTPLPHTLKIETRYKVLQAKGNFSLLEVELISGRSHQIRGQMAALGHPLVGDVKYGASNLSRGRAGQELIAFYIQFDFKGAPNHLSYLGNKVFQLPPQSLFPHF